MDTTRRDFLRSTALAGGALAISGGPRPLRAADAAEPDPDPLPPRALNILILGGTAFLGPHLIAYALGRGHSVTTFTRGRTEPTLYRELFGDVERLVGDRANDLTALEGRSWDAVIDNSGQRVEWTRDSARLLRDRVEQYVYTSSTGVYLPYLGMDIGEDTEVMLEDPPEVPENRRPSYGVMKSLSEKEARSAFGDDRTIVVRPTYIVGPGDTSNRFPYWPARIERGGEVLVPGKADDPVQYIDVRDLTEWMIRLVEERRPGTYNVAGPASPQGMHACVHGIHAATSSEVTWVYATDYDFLQEHSLQVAIPWIMPLDDYVGSARINIDRAKANGLTFRPLARTTMDTLEWWHSGAVTEERRTALLDGPRTLAQREPGIIAAWRARTG